jgi:DNA-binding HxlR family transcriptional regulator
MEMRPMTRVKKTTVCPLGGDGVGGKWKFWILHHLLGGTKRFGELQRLLPEVSRQMLTIQLRELEQTGFLRRQAYVQVPPKVEYSLTELGQRSAPMLRQMYAWGSWCREQVDLEYNWPASDEAEERLRLSKPQLTAKLTAETIDNRRQWAISVDVRCGF